MRLDYFEPKVGLSSASLAFVFHFRVFLFPSRIEFLSHIANRVFYLARLPLFPVYCHFAIFERFPSHRSPS